MRKIIALSGVSGVGKPYHRTTDPALKDLPFVDIADDFLAEPGHAQGEIERMERYTNARLLYLGRNYVSVENCHSPQRYCIITKQY